VLFRDPHPWVDAVERVFPLRRENLELRVSRESLDQLG
jgi:hypothetical protein